MKKNKGFTSIELMIVVAIIGILSAIATTVFQRYVSKTQLARAVGEVGALKASVETRLVQGSDIALNNTEPDGIGWLGSDLIAEATLAGGFADGGGGSGTIEATLQGASSAINGAKIIWSRSSMGVWNCAIDATDAGGGWSDDYAPVGCPAADDD